VQLLFLFVDIADEEISRPTLTLYGLDANEPVVSIDIAARIHLFAIFFNSKF
jgi:hypothetical protein